MTYLDLNNITDLETHYLYIFRKSKCLDTLDKQCERLEFRNKNNFKVLSAINVAWCIRELELKKSGAPIFKQEGMKNVINPL
ncbi:MAG: hypothetical protein V7749_00730 [Cocleimonas sp.]